MYCQTGVAVMYSYQKPVFDTKSISMESMSIRVLAKDDVRSRRRLVVNYQNRGLPTICSYLSQTHHNSVHSIQINELVGKLWCVHLLHLTTFTTSLHLLLTSSFANAIY